MENEFVVGEAFVASWILCQSLLAPHPTFFFVGLLVCVFRGWFR